MNDSLAKEYRRLKAVLDEHNATTMFLAAHLLIERNIRRLIQYNVKYPDQFAKANLKLTALVYIAAGLGLLNEHLSNALIYVDQVRNNLAHSFDFELTSQVTDKLEAMFAKMDMASVPTNTFEEHLEAQLLTLDVLVLQRMPKHVLKAIRAEGKKMMRETTLNKRAGRRDRG